LKKTDLKVKVYWCAIKPCNKIQPPCGEQPPGAPGSNPRVRSSGEDRGASRKWREYCETKNKKSDRKTFEVIFYVTSCVGFTAMLIQKSCL